MRHILLFLIFGCVLSIGAQKQTSSTQKARTSSVSQKKVAAKKTTTGKKTSTKKRSAGKKKKQTTAVVPVTKDIKRLQDEHAILQKQISESQHLLSSTKKDVKSQLANLALINGKISAQQHYVSAIQTEVDTLAYNLKVLDRQLLQLEQELAECKRKFTRSVMYMYRNRQTQNKLMFVFSAENFQQMYRRLRFIREYAQYQPQSNIQVLTPMQRSVPNLRGQESRNKSCSTRDDASSNTLRARRKSASIWWTH